MNADQLRVQMFRMLSATAAMAFGASLAAGSVIVAIAVLLQ